MNDSSTPVDPFTLADEIQPIRRANEHPMPEFARIIQPHLVKILHMGQRATALVHQHAVAHPDKRIIPPHPTIAAIEIACAHLSVGIDIDAMHAADDLAFMADYVSIASNIDRVRRVFPSHVRLRFAHGAGIIDSAR